MSNEKPSYQELEQKIKQLELKLAEFRLIADYSVNWEVLRDHTGKLIYSSPAFEKITGYSNEDFQAGKVTTKDIVHPDDYQYVAEKMKQASEGKPVSSFENRFITREKEIRYSSTEMRPIWQGDTFIGFRATLRDISEIVEAVKALKENEKQFRAVFENSQDAIGISKGGRNVFFNTKFINLFGWDNQEEHVGKSLLEHIAPGERDRIKEFILNREKGEDVPSSYETVGLKKNGEEFPFEVTVGNYELNNEKYTVVNIRDITERKEAEEAIRVSEARLTRAEIVSKSGNWELHLDTRTMVASVGATKIYGVDKDHLDFSVVKEVPLSEYRTMMDLALKELIENDKPYDIEFKIRAVDTGEIKDIHSIAIYDKEKRILFGAILDITDYKRVEEELIKAKEKAEESDRLKTAFLQNMSHEIRTPLNAIMGFSSLFLSHLDDPEKLKMFVNIVETRSNDLLDIINDILDISKIETGSLTVNNEECKLGDLFSELELIFKEQQIRTNKKHISLLFEIDDKLGGTVLITDKGKLKQILVNLIGNALKFTEEGSVKCSCKSEDNKILFMVSDTGIGIPPDKLSYIFERFAQLKSLPKMNLGGTGLGLSIVKGLVNLLGGSVWVNSEIGKGSVFKFTIDYKFTEPKITQHESKPEVISDLKQHKTILIVEDDFYNSEYLKEVLSDFGFTIICAYSAREAIRLVSEQSIDLILMDIQLSDINGYEASKTILESNPNIKIIAQTAYANFEEKDKALKMGCVDYISKPTKRENLINVVQRNI